MSKSFTHSRIMSFCSIVTFVAIFCILFFSWNMKGRAFYNGSGAPAHVGATGDCNGQSAPCTYDNAHFKAVRVTLVYYDGKERKDLADSVIIVSNNDYKSRIIKNTSFTDKNVLVHKEIEKGNGYNIGWMVQNYNEDDENAHVLKMDYVEELLSAMNYPKTGFNLKSDTAPNGNKGYRFIFEPYMSWRMPNGSLQYYTVKDIYGMPKYGDRHTSNRQKICDQAFSLYTKYNDIGIKKGGPYKICTRDDALEKQLENPNYGNGMNIVDVPNELLKKCYKITTTSKQPKCTETNKQNHGEYKEEFTESPCEGDATDEYTKYGKPVRTVNANCKIYCRETVAVHYPGNVLPSISLGKNFVWPTFGKKDPHNLDIEGTRSCASIGSGCNGKSVTVNDVYQNFTSDIKLEYKQKNYNSTITLSNTKVSSSCDGCTGLYDGKTFTATRKVSKKLPDNTYRIVNNKTGIAKDGISVGNTLMYTDVGYGNLPVPMNATVSKEKNTIKYPLKLITRSLGTNGFKDQLSGGKGEYTCKYQLKTGVPTGGDPCICPSGTDNSGKDLWCTLTGNKPTTCATAQNQYCNDETIPSPDDCPPRYCPDKPSISLEACVISGKTYNTCVAELCNGEEPPGPNDPPTDNPPNGYYQCPKNTPNAYMDITGCVESLLSKNISKKEAIRTCQDIVCPLEGGIPIIYRTINLKNPFPSKTANAGIKGFNNDVNGRYPGSNWNSEKLVKTEILNNRGVSNNNIYYNKDVKPLYTIVLDGETIKKIRKYNDKNKYSDFTLKCIGKVGDRFDGSRCLSNAFLRGTISNNIDKSHSTCYSATSQKAYDACAKK